VQCADAQGFGDLAGVGVQHDAWRTRVVERDLDRTPRRHPRTDAQSLEDSLFRGEAGGQTFGLGMSVATFTVSEKPLDDPGVTREREAKAIDVNEIDADSGRGHYSTVTVLARLRGRSTLRPSPRAIVYAKICNGTTSTIGVKSGSVAGTLST